MSVISRTAKPFPAPGQKRFSKRLWLGTIAACILVTLPVLPPDPFTAFSPNRLNVDSIKGMLGATFRTPVAEEGSGLEQRSGLYTANSGVGAEDIRSLGSAVEQLSQQIRACPDVPSLHNRIGILYAELGEFPTAIEHFNNAVDLCRQQIINLASSKNDNHRPGAHSESSILVGSQLNVELSAAHSNLARIYDKLGQHDRVVAQLDQLNRDIAFAGDYAGPFKPGKGVGWPNNKEARLSASAAGSVSRAQALLQNRRVPEAIQEYQNLIKMEPRLALAHQQLGLIFIRQNDLALAIPELQTAVKLDPQDANTRNNLGLAYLASGDRQQANEQFSKACALDPKHIDAALSLANLLSEDGQYSEAIQTLESSLAFNPSSAAGHNNLACLLSLNGKLPEAVSEFKTALSLKPDMATAHYGLGLAWLKMQSYSASIKEFRTALALDPALIDAQNKLEQAYRKNELASSAPGVN